MLNLQWLPLADRVRGHLWSPSYFVGSVGGAPITVSRQYIEGQNRPSAGAL
jgi:putative transposase